MRGQDAGWRLRAGSALDRAEAVYLKVLRASILIVATLLIGLALWLALVGVFKISRSPDSVVEEPAKVEAADIVETPLENQPEPEVEGAEPAPNQATTAAYRQRLNRYYDIYRTRFEPFRQAEDKQISRDEFDDQYLHTADRAMAVAKGERNESQDLAEMDRLIAVLNDAATSPGTVALLQKYQRARKVDVKKTVDKVRTELRSGWDSDSTACADWYLRPYGCASVRSVEVPYSETVTVKEFPEGTLSHAAIFDGYHRRYESLLEERREQNRLAAEMERESILDGRIEGNGSLWFALQLLGAFVILMFFFLLIAIERHQRRMSEEN